MAILDTWRVLASTILYSTGKALLYIRTKWQMARGQRRVGAVARRQYSDCNTPYCIQKVLYILEFSTGIRANLITVRANLRSAVNAQTFKTAAQTERQTDRQTDRETDSYKQHIFE